MAIFNGQYFSSSCNLFLLNKENLLLQIKSLALAETKVAGVLVGFKYRRIHDQ